MTITLYATCWRKW